MQNVKAVVSAVTSQAESWVQSLESHVGVGVG